MTNQVNLECGLEKFDTINERYEIKESEKNIIKYMSSIIDFHRQ